MKNLIEYRNLLLMSLLSLIILYACDNSKKKQDYIATRKVCNNLHLEIFRNFGSGAFGGDILANYLTDSVNFRVYIGQYDSEFGGFTCSCKGDYVIINEFNRESIMKKKVIKTKYILLSTLKQKHNFQ